jgi:hypothetical protein
MERCFGADTAVAGCVKSLKSMVLVTIEGFVCGGAEGTKEDHLRFIPSIRRIK